MGHDLGAGRGTEVGGEEHVVPVAARRQPGRIVDRVDRLPLVQDQLDLAAVADDLDVVVGGFGLVELGAIGRRLDLGRDQRAGPQHDQDQESGSAESRRPGQEAQGGCHQQHHPEADQGCPGAEGRDQDEDGDEGPDDAPGRAESVDGAGGVASGADLAQEQTDGEGGDTAEQDDGHREEQADGEQRAQHQPRRKGGEAVERQLEDRVGDQRDQADPEAGDTGHLEEQRCAWPAVGDTPADPVAHAQIDQDQSDQDAPDVEAVPEVGGDQAGGPELRRQR